MPLAEYLASEQAREDVRETLAQPSQPLGELAPDSEARIGSVRTAPLAVTGSDYKHKGCAWRQVELDHADGCLSVYYRPDGDRFIVTDLGEGVRAACLRGLDLANTEHFDRLNALGRTLDDDFRQTAPLGWIELRDVKPADLPDAICRVMLASLKVAEVQP